MSRAGLPGWSRRASIARRLAFLHIVAAFVSYTVFGLVLYEKRIYSKQRAEERELSSEIVSIKTLMRQRNGKELLEYEMRGHLIDLDSSRMYIRILDRTGQVLSQTQGMEAIVPPSAFTCDSSGVSRWRNPQGDYFLLQCVPLPKNLYCGPGCSLQIATNSNDLSRLQSALRLYLVIFVLSGMAFASLCAYFLVRIALKPLEKISDTARSITRDELDTRIDESELPAELISLAGSFNSMLARLEQSFDRLSQYSGNLAHELRTPINTMMIAADIALSRERSPEEYRSVLASSLDELGRMAVLIDRMLFLARADNDQGDMALQEVEVASEMESLIDYYSDIASEQGITLRCSGDAVVLADQTLFRRAVSNLISNSLAHTPCGGSVTITHGPLPTGEVEVAVQDTGCGIAAEHLSKVFDRFYRVQGSTKKDGNGLGLAIVKAIMQMHQGSVTLDSREGEGTKIALRFPPASRMTDSVWLNDNIITAK